MSKTLKKKIDGKPLPWKDEKYEGNHHTLSKEEVRNNLADIINVARLRGDRVVIEHRGAPHAGIVCLNDLKRLDVLDEHGLREIDNLTETLRQLAKASRRQG